MNQIVSVRIQFLLALLFGVAGGIFCQSTAEPENLEVNFKNPPNSAKPKTWMHTMSGNMSKVGMTKDLEAIAAAGEGGVLLFDIAHGIPYGNVPYDSPKHHDIIKHAASECERLDLSFGVHNCDGWSSSGGPWISPEESMRVIVHRDTVAEFSGEPFTMQLAQPTTREGYYEDIAVLAYPTLAAEMQDAAAKPIITASDPDFNVTLATDKRVEGASTLIMVGKQMPWVQFAFSDPHTIRSLQVVHTQRRSHAYLEISDDGVDFTEVKELFKTTTEKSEHRFVDSFDPITSKYFRLRFSETMRIKELSLSAVQLVNNYIGFSGRGFTSTEKLDMIASPGATMVVKKKDLVDLTKFLTGDGNLSATLPSGTWTILRFGETASGIKNSPASIYGRGLECDKLSRAPFKKHWDNFVQEVIDNTKEVAPNALQYIEIDSYEMGGQNWTDGFDDTFQREKGYDLMEFLPLFAGRYVEDLNTTKRVLWDLNDLLCDLMTKNYYEYFTELCHDEGVLSYVEPYGRGHVNQFDVTGVTDLPMTEFWMSKPHNYVPSVVSGAHIYGKNIVSAESFTSPQALNWSMHPAMAKSDGDKAWAEGINEFMFHRYAHQANTHVRPGMTMSKWGSHIDRTQTWWMNAGKAWFEYIARGTYLLQQGHPVADVLVFVGDVSHNSDVLPKDLSIAVPVGLEYDCTNADVLINRISLKNQKMVLPEGNAYSYLILQNVAYVDLPTVRRLKEIADAGVILMGDKPQHLAGYLNTSEDEQAFTTLVDQIWRSPSFKKEGNFNEVPADLSIKGKEIDFTHRRTPTADIYFFSNETEEADVYEATFRVRDKIPELWNAETGEITRLAQYTHDDEGTHVTLKLGAHESAFVVFRTSSNGLNQAVTSDFSGTLEWNDANELVATTYDNGRQFIRLASGTSTAVMTEQLPSPIDISKRWQVEFFKTHDFAAKENFSTLGDWKDHHLDGIKYYSGTADYTKTITLEKYNSDTKVVLDLGEVSIAAEVFVNGQRVGTLWKAPFIIDVTKYLAEGDNHLRVSVTNQWTNHLIGDERYPKQDGGFQLLPVTAKQGDIMPAWYVNNEPLPAGPRTTFTTQDFVRKDDPLLSSGLLGPVRLTFKKEILIK